MKKISLLGCTGSIGDSTLSVIEQHPDLFELVGVAAHKSWQKVVEIVKCHPSIQEIALYDEEAAQKCAQALNRSVSYGPEGLLKVVDAECDILLNGLVGSIGCLPTIRALETGKDVALANKETLVMAGPVIQEVLEKNPARRIYPVDSEHNAIFQCLADRPTSEVEFLQLTASGGPFRSLAAEEFKNITPERALKHPTWSMGPKITIDSATLMNKGLEVIEAHFLFNVPYEQIQVVVHPQSIIHSLVQFKDGNLMAQLGAPDMRIPIQVALTWPERVHLNCKRISLAEIANLSFFEPDLVRFPCLRLAFEAGKKGGTAPALLNAANEILVPAFLNHQIHFTQIPLLLEQALGELKVIDRPDLSQILEADRVAREWAVSKIS